MSYGIFLKEVDNYFDEREKLGLPKQTWEQNEIYVRDKWIKEKRFSELIAFIHENYDSGQWDEFFEPLEKHLIENKLEKEFIKFWKGILRRRFSSLWHWNKEIGEKTEYWDGAKKTFECQKLTLEGLYRFKQGLTELGAEEEIRKTDELIKTVDKLEKPKPKKTTDKRKIDEKVFWELININREKSEDKIDFIEKLSNQLKEFKPSEIKRFERTFLTKYQELNRWEIWALVYIARRGCGDDAFDYFKAWVISKGQKAFENIKGLKISELKQYFDEDPQLEEMFSLAENVYENKTGELMTPVRVKKQKLSGKEWKEENLEKEFSEIWKIFE
ncbi:DUF4240 domain-containing protein [Polaribacter sp. Hel1_85]|uniref:DUF4240 domain-containing protein n=1 Tax=Polaribacter sp. Hel1_85 TaxID=1250005 RepID=UPI00052BEB78|nr:DUF4240 domain-containing protein [Polaribacter sp. Hel1_85]KGL59085.1 hypothetical protein PHEL85_3359 [Polaribacter sp. Hel1_85]